MDDKELSALEGSLKKLSLEKPPAGLKQRVLQPGGRFSAMAMCLKAAAILLVAVSIPVNIWIESNCSDSSHAEATWKDQTRATYPVDPIIAGYERQKKLLSLALLKSGRIRSQHFKLEDF